MLLSELMCYKDSPKCHKNALGGGKIFGGEFMDSIQIVCEECIFISLESEVDAALEAVNPGAVISSLIQKAKRTVLNIFERIITIVRNIRNLFRKHKKVYLTENSIKMVREGISTVNKATHMVDDLPSILGIQLIRSGYKTISDKIDAAHDVADDIKKMSVKFSRDMTDKLLDQKYSDDKPLDGKIVEYTEYDTDIRYLTQVEDRMHRLIGEIKKADAKLQDIISKHPTPQNAPVETYARNSEAIDEEYGVKNAKFITHYFSAYGSAVTQLLRLVTSVQNAINNAFRVAQKKGVKTPSELRRKSEYIDPTELMFIDDD